MDWDKLFPHLHQLKSSHRYKYIAIGWGDKGFYLNTPEWKDLTVSTACIAAFGLGETALHATYYTSVTESDNCRKAHISKEEYERLISYIVKFIQLRNNESILIETDANYGISDAFYEAETTYSLFTTCNTWVNSGLKKSGLPASLWTALPFGILRNYEAD